jgi:DNA-binding NarL/FixJ family response regulator
MRVFLVEDHAVVRRGIAQLLGDAPDMEVCGEAQSVDEALDLIPSVKPDVALVDISLRGSNGIDLIKTLKAKYPHIVSLVLSMHTEPANVEKALRAGAKGYVTKDQADEVVIEALRRVHGGGMYLESHRSEEVLQRLMDGPEKGVKDRIAELSDRERDVFLMMGEGKDGREIANGLGVNLKTVETYRRRIRAKLDINSMSKLAHAAFEYVSQRDAG